MPACPLASWPAGLLACSYLARLPAVRLAASAAVGSVFRSFGSPWDGRMDVPARLAPAFAFQPDPSAQHPRPRAGVAKAQATTQHSASRRPAFSLAVILSVAERRSAFNATMVSVKSHRVQPVADAASRAQLSCRCDCCRCTTVDECRVAYSHEYVLTHWTSAPRQQTDRASSEGFLYLHSSLDPSTLGKRAQVFESCGPDHLNAKVLSLDSHRSCI